MQEEEQPHLFRFRRLTGWQDKIVKCLSVFFVIYTAVFVLGVLEWVDIWLVAPRHGALHLGTILFLVFLLVPAAKSSPRDRLPWYDACLALLVLPWNGYLVFWFDTVDLQISLAYTPLWSQVFIWVTVLLTMEACRRTIGWPFILIISLFIVYALYAEHFPLFLRAASSSPGELTRYLGLYPEGLYGRLLWISATIVACFVLFGNILAATGGDKFIINGALALFGHVRGGPAKVATLASAGFGMLAGSMIANVATTGVVTIPLMKKTGYTPEFAAAVEAAASTGGHIMPPVMGATIFIMCQLVGMPYWQACIAALLPGVLYFVAIFIMVDLEGAKIGLRGVSRNQLPSLRGTLREGWIYVVPIVSLVVMLFVLMWTPDKSAVYSILTLLLCLFIFKREQLKLKNILRGIEGTINALMQIAPLLALSGLIGGCVAITGLGFRLTSGLLDVAGGNILLLLFLVAVFCIVLGMGLPLTAVYYTVAILVTPAMIALGIVPVAAHLFVIWYSVTAGLTPPVCPMAYVASAISGSHPFRTGWTAARLGAVAFIVPFLFVFRPEILLMGAPVSVAKEAVTAFCAVSILAIGLSGYLLTHLNWIQRTLFLTGTILLFLRGWLTIALAVLVVTAAIVLHLRAKRVAQLK